ncbi:hypothetical protein UT300019_05240 [Clostridium sp. CTA-19]
MSDVNKILGVSKKTQCTTIDNHYSENKIGKALNIMGKVVLIGGIIMGIIVIFTLTTPIPGYHYARDPHPLRWVYGISIIALSFVNSLFFLGLAEAIVLLDKIKKNTSK